MTDDEKRFRDLNRIARRAASRVYDMSNRVVSFEDAHQEALTWLLEHPSEVARRTDEQGELYATDLYALVMRERMVRWARRELGHTLGTNLRDQRFYDKNRIEAILVHAWAPESVQTANETGIRAPKDPATGGNLKAMIADVKRALRSATNSKARAILYARYVLGGSWAEIGRPWGVTDSGARMYAERAIEDMRDFLNGFRPTPDEGPGTREVMSNATARVITERGGSDRSNGVDGIMS